MAPPRRSRTSSPPPATEAVLGCRSGRTGLSSTWRTTGSAPSPRSTRFPALFRIVSAMRRRRCHEAAWVAGRRVPAQRVGRLQHGAPASGGRSSASCRLLVLRSCPELDQAPACSPSSPASKSAPSSPPASCCRRNPTPAAERSVRPTRCMRWLDEQPPGSVVYVALSTEAPVTAEGVHELALGLELSGRASSGLSGDQASPESRRRVHGVGAAGARARARRGGRVPDAQRGGAPSPRASGSASRW
ncbi:hypothetical protein EJB05_13237 [Eragrostis curvula]|uniref:Uncharacterized protein n=1 Tax=Eragrostis curvula TaxID=38414 RepID=A0A5J9VW03_9POAL|nr:hypothetical protein EJB05_13237 [Eragrostis curvula]